MYNSQLLSKTFPSFHIWRRDEIYDFGGSRKAGFESRHQPYHFHEEKNGGQEQFSSRGTSGDGAATYLAYPLDTKSGNTRSEECEKRGENRSAASRLVSGYPSNIILLLAHFKQTRERRIERGEWGWGGRSLQKRVHSPNASVEDVSLFSRFVLNFALCRLPTFFCPSGVPRLQPGWPASGQA